jgi:hypothetical protein
MDRFDDGELYVELEDATRIQAQRALVAARRSIGDTGVSVIDAMHAMVKREAVFVQEMAWEAGSGPEPKWLTDDENNHADIAEEAVIAAEAAADGKVCKLGLMDLPPEEAPVVRDLFECVS